MPENSANHNTEKLFSIAHNLPVTLCVYEESNLYIHDVGLY